LPPEVATRPASLNYNPSNHRNAKELLTAVVVAMSQKTKSRFGGMKSSSQELKLIDNVETVNAGVKDWKTASRRERTIQNGLIKVAMAPLARL